MSTLGKTHIDKGQIMHLGHYCDNNTLHSLSKGWLIFLQTMCLTEGQLPNQVVCLRGIMGMEICNAHDLEVGQFSLDCVFDRMLVT